MSGTCSGLGKKQRTEERIPALVELLSDGRKRCDQVHTGGYKYFNKNRQVDREAGGILDVKKDLMRKVTFKQISKW